MRPSPPGHQQPIRYDRASALRYAHAHWNSVCSDGKISLRNGHIDVPPGTTFVFAPDRSERARKPSGVEIIANFDDCTHFISCCIGRPPGPPAGGLTIPSRPGSEPPRGPYGLVSVRELLNYLRSNRIARAITTDSSDTSAIAQLAPGDLICYSDARGIPSHFVMYAGNQKIVCHTYSRSDTSGDDASWELGYPGWAWTLLRMPS
ncbi:MAG: hypothetical protein E6J42_02490 [Chloroflexi bacterium]|nr:MAG: hypothetical protein E6J42_02490 [Chloroflexota bacterium]